MRRKFLSAGALLAVAIAANAAGAQPAPAASPEKAGAGASGPVPPTPLAPLVAPYPAGAHGDAEVVLEISVDVAGVVGGARPIAGDEPFVSAALAAARDWKFAAGTRDGAPVAARIRAAIRFHEERAPTAPPLPAAKPSSQPATSAAASTPGTAPTPEAPTKAAPLEVNVRGVLAPPSTESLTRAEVRLLPGAFGDPFRAIESMPGVSPIASGVPYFFVRGAPPGNVGYFLDGIRVPILFHLGLGPSVVHPAMIGQVDLYEGGYPAQFGRFAGAIVTGSTLPPQAEAHGEGNIRLVDAGALVEAPFDGGKGAALAGGRYGYTALLLKLIQPDVDLAYWDYQARVSHQVGAHDVVSAFAFGSYDHWATKENGAFQTLFDTTFHRLDLRYDHPLAGGGSLRQAVTLGIDHTGLGEGRSVVDRMIAARTEVEMPLTPDARLRFGVDMIVDAIESDLDRLGDEGAQQSIDSLFPSRTDLSVGLRGDVVLALGPRFELTPGLRVDLYGSDGNTAIGIDPRLSARLALTPRLRLVQAHGLASQPPSFFLPGPGLQPALKGGLQRSFQSSGGFEADLPLDVKGTLTVFRDAFFDMTDPLGSTPSVGSHIPDNFGTRSNGQAYGLELGLKRRLTKQLGGFVSYTLARSTRTVGRDAFPSSFDRTHVLNTAASYDFGRGWHAGARTVFYTGAPAVLSAAQELKPSEDVSRLPPFFRLDLRVEKRWHVGKKGFVSFVIELLNATFTKETVGVDCGESSFNPFAAPTNCKYTTIGPVTIPSIGVEAGF